MYSDNYNSMMPLRPMNTPIQNCPNPYYYQPGNAYPMNPMNPTEPRESNKSPNNNGPTDQPLPVMKGEEYLQGYLKSIIGEFVRIDFLIGTNTFLDKEGTLLDVGVDYVVLREAETDDLTVGDLYSIKFVKVLR